MFARISLPAVSAALAAATIATSGFAATIVGFAPLPGASTPAFITPTAINDSGLVVGSSSSSQRTNHAFSYGVSTGTLTDMGPVASADSSYYSSNAGGVNASGTIAETYSGASTSYRNEGLLYNGGALIQSIIPAGYQPTSVHLNNAGTVVGVAYTSTYAQRAYVLPAGGTFTALGTLAGGTLSILSSVNNNGLAAGVATINGVTDLMSVDTTVSSPTITDLGTIAGANILQTELINDSGVIAGTAQFTSTNASQAFIHTGSTFTALNTPTGTGNTTANGIDVSGDVVGFGDSGSGSHAFLWLAGSTTAVDLNTYLASVDPTDAASWVLGTATAINNKGVIVGTGSYNGVSEAFVLDASGLIPSAVPEPLSLGLMAPLALVALRRRRSTSR